MKTSVLSLVRSRLGSMAYLCCSGGVLKTSSELSLLISTQEAPKDCRHVSLTLHRDGIFKSSKTAGQRGAYALCEGHLWGR